MRSTKTSTSDNTATHPQSAFFKQKRQQPFFSEVGGMEGSGMIQKDDEEEGAASTPSPEASEEEEAGIGMGSPLWPWQVIRPLLWEAPGRWARARGEENRGHLIDPTLRTEDRFNQLAAIQNLLYAGILAGDSPYPDMGFSEGMEMAEELSGVSDSYIHLGSLLLRRNLDEYLSEDFPDIAQRNLGWLLLYGIPLQAGLVGLNYATESELDFTSLIGLGAAPFTERPFGLERLHLLDNIPDERWRSYPFLRSPEGLELKWDHLFDEQPDSLSAQFGFNIPQTLDRDNYPSEEEEREQYHGLELFPYGYYNWQRQSEDDTAPRDAHRWMAGMFGGYGGVYGLLEGGQRRAPAGGSNEDFMRAALHLRRFGPMRSTQVEAEFSNRPEFGSWRPRFSAATDFNILDSNRWNLTAGARLGGLTPSADQGGALEGGGALGFHHLTQVGDENDEPLRTGVSAEYMNRLQDPFDETSPRLNSLNLGLSFWDVLRFSAGYHNIQGATPDSGMPDSDFRFMLMMGPGMFYLGELLRRGNR